MDLRPELLRASDRSLLVRFAEEMAPGAGARVAALLHRLEAARLPGVVNLHPAYASLLVVFDPLTTGYPELAAALASLLEPGAADEAPPRTVEVPVLYGGAAGPDLDGVAAHTGLSPDEVIARHAAGSYRVAFLGFSPGFAYLEGLAPELATPRLSRPRPRVPAGSVGIAGGQTGVYPLETPGGWRLIGRTPLRLFRPEAATRTPLVTGDLVRFVPVGPDELARLSAEGR